MPKFESFVVSYGAENYLLDRDIEKMSSAKRRVSKWEASNLKAQQLIDLCETYSEEPRTIIVDNCEDLKDNKTKDLQKFFENIQSNPLLLLVFVVRSNKLPEPWRTVANLGKSYERKKFNPWKDDEYLDFIRAEFKKTSVKASDEVVGLLLKYVGKDLYRLSAEIRKLTIYLGTGSVEKNHIASLTSLTPQVDITSVVDSIMKKESNKALDSLRVLEGLSSDKDKTVLQVARALMKQVERAIHIKALQTSGAAEADVAGFLDMNEWRYKNFVAPMVHKHELSHLIKVTNRLRKLDEAVVCGDPYKRQLLELAVLDVSGLV